MDENPITRVPKFPKKKITNPSISAPMNLNQLPFSSPDMRVKDNLNQPNRSGESTIECINQNGEKTNNNR